MDVAERLAIEYYHDDTAQNVSRIREMLSVPGIHWYLSPDDVLWVYILLSDEGLEILRNISKEEEFTSDLSEQLLKHPGNHIYIFRSLSPNDASSRVAFRRAANFLLQKHHAVDISWHDDKRVHLHTFGGN